MRLLRTFLLLGCAAAVAATSAVAGGAPTVTLYPAIVNVELVRTAKQLENAMAYQDEGDGAHAAASLTAARSHMRKAWIAAKFVIDNAPPPVAEAGSLSRPTIVPRAKAISKAKAVKKATPPAHTSGGAIAGATPYADQYTTAAAVFTLQDQVAETALGMLAQADATVLPVASSTLFAALNDRDTAIAYIHSLPVPPAAAAGTRATISGGVIAGTWDTTMSSLIFQIDDELQLVDGMRASLNLSPGRAKVLDATEIQNIKSERKVNLYWPPAPAAG
jgi:hypothetical protein